MKIKFCGAALGVTGSCHLITTDNHKILFDCGMFQGGKAMEALNYEDFPFNPAEIECVVISHAHIDHCGRLPLLVKNGFKGDIYASDATADLLDVMLKDAAHIQEQDAEWQSKRNLRAGKKAVEPLYTAHDVEDTLKFIRPVRYDQLFELNDQMKIVFNDAGHILGSAIIELFCEEEGKTTKLVFSGDLGMSERPILNNPKIIHKADYVVMETTYGDRIHEANATSISRLLDIAVETVKRGGNVVIPSFAVGRTQELLFELNKVYDGTGPMHDALIDVPVYVDSPMAIKATEIFKNNAQAYDEETREYILRGDHPLDFKNLHFTQTSQESQAINIDNKPKIIISASGMCDAGRIRHHLKHNLWNKKNSIVFVGYQAADTLGRRILEGVKTVTLFGEEVSVAAQIHNLEGFSGHADRDALFAWLTGFEKMPKKVFLVHGEMEAKENFAKFVEERCGWQPVVVRGYNEYDLAAGDETENETAELAFALDEDVESLRRRISDMHSELESILYNTKLAVDGEISVKRMVELKNNIAELEKDIYGLGATITKEDRNEQ
ncbi:MAG: MBL fold metallo-hydrolase [Bacillota bacterium]|nr:MBL fold metallo-hydrolase [Bacillota bacterium]